MTVKILWVEDGESVAVRFVVWEDSSLHIGYLLDRSRNTLASSTEQDYNEPLMEALKGHLRLNEHCIEKGFTHAVELWRDHYMSIWKQVPKKLRERLQVQYSAQKL